MTNYIGTCGISNEFLHWKKAPYTGRAEICFKRNGKREKEKQVKKKIDRVLRMLL